MNLLRSARCLQRPIRHPFSRLSLATTYPNVGFRRNFWVFQEVLDEDLGPPKKRGTSERLPFMPPPTADEDALDDALARIREIEVCEDPDALQRDLDKLLALSRTGETVKIWKQILFALGFSGFVFTVAAVKTNLNSSQLAEGIEASGRKLEDLDIGTLLEEKMKTREESVDEVIKWFDFDNDSNSTLLFKPIVDGLAEASKEVKPGQWPAYALCAINIGIFLAWNTPKMRFRGVSFSLRPFLTRTFVHRPLSGRTYTMLSSIFLHQELIHVGFFTFLLPPHALGTWWALTCASNSSGRSESSLDAFGDALSVSHTCALLLSAGVFGSLGHHILIAKFRWPTLLAQFRRRIVFLRKPDFTKLLRGRSISKVYPIQIVPMNSIGMSGTIWASLAISVIHSGGVEMWPEFEVSFEGLVLLFVSVSTFGLIYVPMLPAAYGAHLVSGLFGVVYYQYGPQFWLRVRLLVRPLTDWMHERRST